MNALRDYLGAAYAAAPLVSPGAPTAWAILAEHSHHWAGRVLDVVTIQMVDDPEPYKDAGAMYYDIAQFQRLKVSRANSDHPVWTPEDNYAFRAVHDYFGHYSAWKRGYPVTGFTWEGEVTAMTVQEEITNPHSPIARRALLTEGLAQTASLILTPASHIQKAALL